MSDRREFLELAHVFEPKKHLVSGWLVSCKLDGHRAFWDGGITRGMNPEDVPWANTAKDARYIERPLSTGLWSRGGKTIQAPDWWLNTLPEFVFLDGELWAGNGQFQYTSSTVKQLYPVDADWKNIIYMVFDSPSPWAFSRIGRINTPNFSKNISIECWEFIKEKFHNLVYPMSQSYDNAMSLVAIKSSTDKAIWNMLKQEKLPAARKDAQVRIDDLLAKVEAKGGEGLILRHPTAPWEPKRTSNLLKVKSRKDAEAEVIGYIWGRKTDRGSKLLGLMGAMVLKMPNGIQFELSGFTDAERKMEMLPHLTQMATSYLDSIEGHNKPGERVSAYWWNPKFPIGSTITYKYRELSNDGIPKEAQYSRPYESV